jgi:hypothetical protein
MPHRSGRHRGEFEGDSPTEEVAAQIRLRGTDPVQLRAQEIEFRQLCRLARQARARHRRVARRQMHRAPPVAGGPRVRIALPPAGSLVRTHHAALEKRGTRAPLQRKTDDRRRDGYRQSARGWGESSAVTGRIAAFAPPISPAIPRRSRSCRSAARLRSRQRIPG